MESFVKSFDDFINEEFNVDRISDVKCYLTKRWYYYDDDSDIVYGSDTKPIDDSIFVFENKLDETDICLFTLDLNEMELETYNGHDEVGTYLGDIIGEENVVIDDTGWIDDDFLNKIQDSFDDEVSTRSMLIMGNRVLASSFDIVENDEVVFAQGEEE